MTPTKCKTSQIRRDAQRLRYARRRDACRCVECNFQMDSDRYARCAACRSKQAAKYRDDYKAGTRKGRRRQMQFQAIKSLNRM